MSNYEIETLPQEWRERFKKKSIYQFCIENGYIYTSTVINGVRYIAIANTRMYSDNLSEIKRIYKSGKYKPYEYLGSIIFVPEIKSQPVLKALE